MALILGTNGVCKWMFQHILSKHDSYKCQLSRIFQDILSKQYILSKHGFYRFHLSRIFWGSLGPPMLFPGPCPIFTTWTLFNPFMTANYMCRRRKGGLQCLHMAHTCFWATDVYVLRKHNLPLPPRQLSFEAKHWWLAGMASNHLTILPASWALWTFFLKGWQVVHEGH